MMKYSVAALLGCLYVIGSVFLVQRAGRTYRESLAVNEVKDSATSVAVNSPAIEPAPPAVRVEPKPTEPPSPKAQPSTPEPKPTQPQPPSNVLASTSAPKPVPQVVPPPAPQPMPQTVAPPGEPAAPKPSSSPAPPRNPAFEWADGLDLSRLKPAEERRLGKELHALILSYNKPLETAELQERLERVARPLLEGCTRKDVEYTFTLLDSNAVNAFSVPGGYVYVCRGLFDLIGEDEDYALEFVLAHEIAHVDAEHARKFVEKVNSEEKKRGLGTLLQFYLLIAFGLADDQEFAADAWAFQRMKQLDRTKREALAFLRKFKKHAERNGFATGRKPPEPGKSEMSAVDNHFRALPAAWKRLDRLQK